MLKFAFKVAIAVLALQSCVTKYNTSNPYESADFQTVSGFKQTSVPLRESTKFKVSQGAFGCCTHNVTGYEYAWDFDVPFGTEVTAVEGGSVIQVWEPAGLGSCDVKQSELAHNIKILHADGTVAQYVHIEARVKKGERVQQGQLIAVTANNGYLCRPQLHFNMFRDADHIPETNQPVTIPLRFREFKDGIAREGSSRP